MRRNSHSPYASPRDGARHRFQATLAELQSNRDVKAALQGFAEAFAADRTYAAAAFNLGVLAAVAEKWGDALAALEEAGRLDPTGLGKDGGAADRASPADLLPRSNAGRQTQTALR